jgi:hypothetical protein
MSNKSTAIVATMGIDIGKNSFHVIGLDGRGAIVLRQKWSRGQVGPEQPLQAEAGYIDARPQRRQIDENLLRRTAGPYIATHGAVGGTDQNVPSAGSIPMDQQDPAQRRPAGASPLPNQQGKSARREQMMCYQKR